jgi:DNA-binding NtrC family response regulator
VKTNAVGCLKDRYSSTTTIDLTKPKHGIDGSLPMPKLLIVDDEPSVRLSIRMVLNREDLVIFEAETPDEAKRITLEESPDVVLLDIRLGAVSGLELFHELHRLDPKSLVIFVTGFGTAETAIQAMKLGAYDYLTKPLDAKQLKRVVEQALVISRMAHVPTILDEGDRPEDRPERLIGSGMAMQAVCKQIGRVAPQDVNVLIVGESGTGKELVAKALYHHSRRGQAPFLAINCAAIPESLLESELFGHERGAFTGADRRRIGKFEQAHGGTLFLDEVGDMAPHTQAKILRLIQERCFERLGGNQSISVNVRILAATNQDLDALIAKGQFRKDLYYRLSGVTIPLPPLRERPEDIPELAHYFLFRYNRQLGTSVQSISPEVLELLQAYRWPGNVRELQNVIRRTLIGSAGSTIVAEFLPTELLDQDNPETDDLVETQSVPDTDWHTLHQNFADWLARGETDLYRRAREQFDRLVILGAMQHVGGNRSQASKILGLSHVTLRAKLRGMSDRSDAAPADTDDNRTGQ